MGDEELIELLPVAARRKLERYRDGLARMDPGERRYFCWGPGTDPVVVEAFRRAEIAGGLAPGEFRTQASQFLSNPHWFRTATDGSGNSSQGLPVTLTWSVVPDGTTVPGDTGSPDGPSNLRSWLAGLYGGSTTGAAELQPWFPLFVEAFAQLGDQCGITFVHEPNDDQARFTSLSSGQGILGVRGDIRISGRDIDGNSGTLAFAYGPDYGDIVIDTDDSFFNSTFSNSVRLLNTLAHEAGHAVGLDHVCPVNETKLMEPFISTAYRGAQFDEFQSLQRQYGDPEEAHSSARNNDSSGDATPLGLVPGSTLSWQWLSIDDSLDVDYYSFSGQAGGSVDASVAPADPGAYLEGSQGGTCSAGTSYDPSLQQDLTIEVLNPDGSPLDSSASAGIGQPEGLAGVELPVDGTYFIRVNGGNNDVAQLYTLEAAVTPPSDEARLEVVSSRIDAESNLGGNGAIDPGETIRLAITVENAGSQPAGGVTAVLSGPTGFVPFEVTVDGGDLDPGASAEWMFTFAQSGECGDALNLLLSLSWLDGATGELLPVVLGPEAGPSSAEGFDLSPALPPGWSTSSVDAAAAWAVVDDQADSPPNAVFADSVSDPGEAILVSPEFTVASGGGSLAFRHRYDLESGYDGGVVEASLDGGPWFDLVDAASGVTAGGYNDVISTRHLSPIGGRSAWSGDSGGFVTTSLSMPPAWAGQLIRFRWRAGFDRSVSRTGWWIDSVDAVVAVAECDPFLPGFSLAVDSSQLDEGNPGTTVGLTLSTPLPLPVNVSVFPAVSGSADASDLANPLELLLPAGETSTSIQLTVVDDWLAEGDEELVLAIPPEGPGFGPLSPSSVSITITDPEVIPATLTLGGLSQLYDGTPRTVSVETTPEGVPVTVTYDGSTGAPTAVGSYAVVATAGGNYSGTATGTLVVGASYLSWQLENPGLVGGPDDDDDGDGWPNAAEYVFVTDPLVRSSIPQPVLELGPTQLEWKTPGAVERADVVMSAEASGDLASWSSAGVIETAEGFAVARDGPMRYLRLVFTTVP